LDSGSPAPDTTTYRLGAEPPFCTRGRDHGSGGGAADTWRVFRRTKRADDSVRAGDELTNLLRVPCVALNHRQFIARRELRRIARQCADLVARRESALDESAARSTCRSKYGDFHGLTSSWIPPFLKARHRHRPPLDGALAVIF
jgi:hypothetical protein